MKVYIDFDGVIYDTEGNLFYLYRKMKSLGLKIDKVSYIEKYDWEELLAVSPVIANALNLIKMSSYEISVLTKVHSLNEGCQKVKLLRQNRLKNEIIIVPNGAKKSEVVFPAGNILIDDQMNNLTDWYNNGGLSIFFNKNSVNIDSHGNNNDYFPMISDLRLLTYSNGIENVIEQYKSMVRKR